MQKAFTPDSLEEGDRAPSATGEPGRSGRWGALEARNGPPPFHISQLWKPPVVSPVNGKSYTLPIFNLNNPYSRNFHLSWLGFFVAFLSWFAFPPLMPEAIRADLKLTPDQVANSNIVSLCATLIVRVVCGPLIDRFGPRHVMAGLLVLGAIPSGLAGTVSSAGGLYTIRFFIGTLGGTFVPCQAWTSVFFSKEVVGTANALVGGWGNMGGGVTFAVQVALYTALRNDGLSQHSAWRAAFAIVPVPILLFVAALTWIFGTDHPAGKWSQRHSMPATTIAVMHGHEARLDHAELASLEAKKQGVAAVVPAQAEPDLNALDAQVRSELDTAVNEVVTPRMFIDIVFMPQTWLAGVLYLSTFGLELAIDANLASILFGLYHPTDPSFTQQTAGYYTSLFGLLNLWTRPLGGYVSDKLYGRFGVPARKWYSVFNAIVMGAFAVGLGVYIDHHVGGGARPDLGVVIGLVVLLAVFSEMGNGAVFGMVPHLNPHANGIMSGVVGSMGNLGGIWFALIARYQPSPPGKCLWIVGVVNIVASALVAWVPVPKW